MGSLRVHGQKAGMNQSGEHRLGRTSGHDEIELLDQPDLFRLVLIMAPVITRGGYIDRSVDKVVPTEDLLGPQLEGEQEMEITAFGQGHLTFTEAQKALHRI